LFIFSMIVRQLTEINNELRSLIQDTWSQIYPQGYQHKYKV